jgi:hypothetical protein
MTDMAMDDKRHTATAAAVERIKEAETVRDELCVVLHRAGVVLPSLRVEPAAYADEKPRPLVELGRCNLQTARKLIAVLQDRTGGAEQERQK